MILCCCLPSCGQAFDELESALGLEGEEANKGAALGRGDHPGLSSAA